MEAENGRRKGLTLVETGRGHSDGGSNCVRGWETRASAWGKREVGDGHSGRSTTYRADKIVHTDEERARESKKKNKKTLTGLGSWREEGEREAGRSTEGNKAAASAR